MGKGGNPGSLPGGSEFSAGGAGSGVGMAVGGVRPSQNLPRAPLGAQAPPIPAHLWARQAPREARRARAASGGASSAGLGSSAEVPAAGRGPSVPGPPCCPLEKTSRRVPWSRASAEVPGGPQGQRRAVVALRRAAKAAPALAAQHYQSAAAPYLSSESGWLRGSSAR